jgi:hypothetical protein
VTGLDEPVRRFLEHAAPAGAPPIDGARLIMSGRVRVGSWLPFTAEQQCAPLAFRWQARVGRGPLAPLSVVDRFADGAGHTEVRLLGRLRIADARDEDTTRSAAGRAALEAATFVPASLVGRPEVAWRAEREDLIVVSWDVPPERPEVRIHIDADGAPRTVSADRWRRSGKERGYVPCGCEIHAERRFGDFLVPTSVTVAWWFGTPREAPFFRAQIRGFAPVPRASTG